MTESKRFVHAGVVFSIVGHACLLLALLFFVRPARLQPVSPEPIAVDIVPADEVLQPGTPLESTSHGSEVSSASKSGSESTARWAKSNQSMSLEQTQAGAREQRGGSPAGAPQHAPPPGEGETPPLSSEGPVTPIPAAEARPRRNEAQRQANAGEMFAMPLPLPAGQLGGGLDAPSSNPAMLPHDDIAAFRARLAVCSRSAPYPMDGNDAIELRVLFKRDGRLAAPPELLRSTLSAGAVALTKIVVDALERCQPFAELPADKYKEWKTLNLMVVPSVSRE